MNGMNAGDVRISSGGIGRDSGLRILAAGDSYAGGNIYCHFRVRFREYC